MNTFRRLPILLAMLALAAATVSACGEDTTETFKDDFSSVNDQVLALGSEVGTAVSEAKTKTDQQLAAEFSAIEQRTRAAQQKLEDLDPPEELESGRDDLVDALGAAADDLRAISDAARQGDAEAAAQATAELAADSPKIRDARQALARKTGARLG
jgi:hypothetical protein